MTWERWNFIRKAAKQRSEQVRPGRRVTEVLTLDSALRRYREASDENRLTPELVTQTWRVFWQNRVRGAGENLQVTIPRCDYTAEELRALGEQNPRRGVVYLPQEIMTGEGRALLYRLFPEAFPSRVIKSDSAEGGWFDVEMQTEPPHIGLGLVQMRRYLKAEGKDGQNFQTYIVASVFHKLLTGKFFDETGASTLPGSHGGRGNYLSFGALGHDQPRLIRFGDGHDRRNGVRTQGRKSS